MPVALDKIGLSIQIAQRVVDMTGEVALGKKILTSVLSYFPWLPLEAAVVSTMRNTTDIAEETDN